MLTRNEKEICSTIFQFSSVFSSKFLYFCRGCFLNLLLSPSPCPFSFLFLLLLWHTTRVVPQQNRSRVLGLKCIMDETTRPIVVYLKDTYVSVSAPACHAHTHTQSLAQKGHRLRVAPATCHLLKQYQTDPKKKRSASSVSPSLPPLPFHLLLLPHKVK